MQMYAFIARVAYRKSGTTGSGMFTKWAASVVGLLLPDAFDPVFHRRVTTQAA
jgi:hypothetical protein